MTAHPATPSIDRAHLEPDVHEPDVDARASLEPVYVWDVVVRVTHWSIALSMLVLALTGIYIARPFIIASGETGSRLVMSTVKMVHYYGAIVFSLAVASRILWMFVGPKYAGWRQFIPVSAKRRRHLIGTLKFYVLLADRPPAATGHNPLAGVTYVAVFALCTLMILTGFAMYSAGAYTSYMSMWSFLVPVFGGLQSARWIHHVVMWLLIGFVVNHVFSAVLMSRVEKNGAIGSIFTGDKFLPKDRDDSDE